MTEQELITEAQRRKMAKAFFDAVAGIKNSVKLRQLEALIESNDIEGVIKLLGLDEATFAPLANAIADSQAVGGNYTADFLSPIPVPDVGDVQFKYNSTSAYAIQWAAKRSSDLIVEIVKEQRNLVRGHIAQAVMDGVNPRQTALELVGRTDPASGNRVGGFIGLTEQQAGWVNNARIELMEGNNNYFTRQLRDRRFDGLIQKTKADGRKLTKAQIDNIITQMQVKALKYRGDTIARTESLNALRAGQFIAMLQAAEKGEIDPRDVEKTWDATGDELTRPDHLRMEGVSVPLKVPFTLPNTHQVNFPGDASLGAEGADVIQCRCVCVYSIDFIGRAVRKVRGF